MDRIHHVHMERPDPRALDMHQVCIAYVEQPSAGVGIVVLEEGARGSSYRRTETARDSVGNGDPVDYLEKLIDERKRDGWEVLKTSCEPRFFEPPAEHHLYQFKGGDKTQQLESARKIVRFLSACDPSQVQWITPQVLSHLDADEPPVKWRAEVDIGRDRIAIETGNRFKNLLSVVVPTGSMADNVLMLLAACKMGYVGTVTDQDAMVIDAEETARQMAGKQEDWLADVASKWGVAPPRIRLNAEANLRNAGLVPVIF